MWSPSAAYSDANFKPVHTSRAILFDLIMDISQENYNEDLDSLSKDIPVLSEYAKVLETHVKRRY